MHIPTANLQPSETAEDKHDTLALTVETASIVLSLVSHAALDSFYLYVKSNYFLHLVKFFFKYKSFVSLLSVYGPMGMF